MRAGWRVGHGIGHHPPLYTSFHPSLPQVRVCRAPSAPQRSFLRGRLSADLYGGMCEDIGQEGGEGGRAGCGRPSLNHYTALVWWSGGVDGTERWSSSLSVEQAHMLLLQTVTENDIKSIGNMWHQYTLVISVLNLYCANIYFYRLSSKKVTKWDESHIKDIKAKWIYLILQPIIKLKAVWLHGLIFFSPSVPSREFNVTWNKVGFSSPKLLFEFLTLIWFLEYFINYHILLSRSYFLSSWILILETNSSASKCSLIISSNEINSNIHFPSWREIFSVYYSLNNLPSL